ncbi:DUF222 domain-containing protein [Paenarthrobacter sp. TYUT067]|uniref:HNH endonuclease signature motif containing protein n=1 Tax=Paenarthrobacter sp. TYUT067 TaxID=2926245 RepID=UPI00202ED57C|nr:HNH endonuclease signature motif containing protein [Paenarthrobacter sp. TYUT067]MCM0615118.1 DUF222 domain-containing protein [Paenarthrobacter sp. TYUT067]
MENLAQSTASWAESSPAVAALAAVRSQRSGRTPHLIRAGRTDSTAHITVIEHFHGVGMANDTGRLYGDRLHKDAGRLHGTAPVKAPGGLNSPQHLSGEANFARISKSTAAPTTRAQVDNTALTLDPRRKAWAHSSLDSDRPIQRQHGQIPEPTAVSGSDFSTLLDEGAALLDSARLSAADEVRLLGFVEAADFAGRVEEISRSVEYLQVVAAQAVERTRKEALQARPGASAAAPEWRTGWTEPAGASAVPAAAVSRGTAPAGASQAEPDPTRASPAEPAHTRTAPVGSFLDDGYRNTAEFLRARLRIGIGEARRRLALAADALPQTGMTGQDVPARREALADALASGELSSRSASIISTALDKVRHLADEEMLTRMEHALTATAVESDPDFVSKMARRWTDLIDHDGPEPTEEILRQHQGAFLRRRRRYGLHHIEIFATDEQYETLTTTMNTATNPRLTTAPPDTAPASSPITGAGHGRTNETSHGHGPHASPMHASPTHASAVFSPASTDSAGKDTADGPDLDRRSRAQKLLDGLVGACSVAMSTGKLPSNGGLRPQLTVTIDHRDLFTQLTGPGHAAQNRTTRQADQSSGSATAPNQPNTPNQPGTGASRYRPSTGTATFLGPIHPTTIRKIACDADIIPALLGSDSRILDIGRTTRIFPPHIRKAITARDQGCTFPDCTMPAPWCEAHHTTYWSHGGTTGTDNGTLLCSHHHHIIHKEQWRIVMTTGAPWFIPPPHIDPYQKPRRNHHHTPQRT